MLDGEPPADTATTNRGRSKLGFQFAGLAATAAAFVVAYVALAFVGLATFCTEADEASMSYRLSGVAAGFGVALVPALWALRARSSGRMWIPWAIAAAAFLVGGVFLGFSTPPEPAAAC